MGSFTENLKREFGKGTGRALTNKLYGKNAEHKIGVSRTSASTEEVVAKENAKVEKAKLRSENFKTLVGGGLTVITGERESVESHRALIRDIHFDVKDFDGNIAKLTELVSIIDGAAASMSTNLDFKNVYRQALGKFESGLAMCQAIEPNNPTLSYFASKLETLKSKDKKKEMTKWILIAVSVVAVLIFYIVSQFS